MSLPLWAVATFPTSQRRWNKHFFFLRQRVCTGGWSLPASRLAAAGWLLFPLSTQGGVRPSLQRNQQPLSQFCAPELPSWPPSLSPLKETERNLAAKCLWIRVCVPYLSPKSSKAFSCILFTYFPCQISLDENRAWQEGRKKEITQAKQKCN